MKRIILILLSVAWLAGCGHVEEIRSERLNQAADFNQRAQRAFLRGEYRAAAELYEQALRLDVAIENENGIAINILNLARVYQVLGNPGLAQQLLDRLLGDRALQYAPAHLAEAAVQKALLRLQDDDVAGAAELVEKAAVWCGQECRIEGVIENVRAGIALRRGEIEAALRLAEHAIAINHDDPLEHANALRLTASALLMRNEPGAALLRVEEALMLDKKLGLPEKIRQDLLLAAQACDKLGRAEQAEHYRDRAARIAATTVR